MHKIKSWSAALFCALGVLSCDREPTLAEAAGAINAKCPVMVDAETRLDAVTSGGEQELSYHFTLVNANVDLADTAGLRKALWPGLLSGIRTEPAMEKLRAQRVTIRYFYKDREGKPLLTFVFDAGDYR